MHGYTCTFRNVSQVEISMISAADANIQAPKRRMATGISSSAPSISAGSLARTMSTEREGRVYHLGTDNPAAWSFFVIAKE